MTILNIENPSDRIEVRFTPKNIFHARRTETDSVAISGQNNPSYHYSGGFDELSVELDLHSMTDKEEAIRKAKWLQSMAMADRGKKPRVKLVYGKMFRSEVWQVLSVDANYSLFDPTAGNVPKQAYVNVTFGLYTAKNLRRADVRW
jgi:energy-coupling factor transporter ATP-binding protein EcfA2